MRGLILWRPGRRSLFRMLLHRAHVLLLLRVWPVMAALHEPFQQQLPGKGRAVASSSFHCPMPRGALVGPGDECGQPCRGLGIQASGRVSSEFAIPLPAASASGARCFSIAITGGPGRERRSVRGSSAVFAALPIHRPSRNNLLDTHSRAPRGG